MSVLAAVANGNLTSSSTWGLIDGTSYNNSESSGASLTTSFVESTGTTTGVETIDGVAVKIASRAASPTGTITVHLAIAGVEVVGSAVTVNVSDLPTCTATSGSTAPVDTAEGGWFFFKFSSPLTLAGATSYTVGAKTSSSSQVSLWSSATTNWSRYLRTTTTQAPTTGDDMIITGEWTAAATVTSRTVTMDSTSATDYGNNAKNQVTPAMAICKGGTLTFSTSASVNLILQLSGYLVVYNGGTFTQGVNGSQVPSTSTATIQFDCDVAAGDFGAVARNLSTFQTGGSGRTSGNNTVITFLTADVAASGTAVTVNDSTGWLSGDSVCYAPTGIVATTFEKKALTAPASGTSLTSTAMTNAHSGTAPTQGEVGLLTHNVVFTQTNSAKQAFLYCGTTAAVSLYHTEFAGIGMSTQAKMGIAINNSTSGSFLMDHCSAHDCYAGVVFNGGNFAGATATIQYSVIYNVQYGVYNPGNSNGNIVIDHCMYCGTLSGGLMFYAAAGNNNVTYTNNYVSGCVINTACLYFNNTNTFVSFDGNSTHSNTGGQSMVTGSPFYGTISNSKFWHNDNPCNISGTQTSQSTDLGANLLVKNCDFYGNGSFGLWFNTGRNINAVLDGCTFNSTPTRTQPDCLTYSGPGVIYMYNCQLSGTATGKTVCTNNFNAASSGGALTVIANNCIFASTNMLNSGQFSGAFPTNVPVLLSTNHGQVANDNRAYYHTGVGTVSIVQSDSGTVHGTDPLSEKMSPLTAAFKTKTSVKLVPCPSGSTRTFSIYVQKNGSYNGNAPRLILLRNDAMGITADTVCATFSAGSGTWQQLSYTTPTAPQDGVFAFLVDSDGTAGAIFVGDAAAS